MSHVELKREIVDGKSGLVRSGLNKLNVPENEKTTTTTTTTTEAPKVREVNELEEEEEASGEASGESSGDGVVLERGSSEMIED